MGWNHQLKMLRVVYYCWWKESCTSWYGWYPFFDRVPYGTVWMCTKKKWHELTWIQKKIIKNKLLLQPDGTNASDLPTFFTKEKQKQRSLEFLLPVPFNVTAKKTTNRLRLLPEFPAARGLWWPLRGSGSNPRSWLYRGGVLRSWKSGWVPKGTQPPSSRTKKKIWKKGRKLGDGG